MGSRAKSASLAVLGFLVEAIEHVRHDIARQGIEVGLSAPLRVDELTLVAQVAENVEAVEHQCNASLGERLVKAGVPHQVVGVGAGGGVAAVAVDGEVGGDLYVQRQLEESGQPIVEVTEGVGVEVLASGADVTDADIAFYAKGVFAQLVLQLDLLRAPPCVDAAAVRL